MNTTRCNQLAKQVIDSNIYMTLATTNGLIPWASPVYYCTDPDYNFYYISQTRSRHSRYLKKNPQVAFAIFDSHAPEGKGNGVQGSGIARQLPWKEIPHALKHYRTTFIPLKPAALLGKNPYRIFKLAPEKMYVLDEDAVTDRRKPANPKGHELPPL